MQLDLTSEDLELIGRALMSRRWEVEHNTAEGVKHQDFSHAASLADRLAMNHNGAKLIFNPPKKKE